MKKEEVMLRKLHRVQSNVKNVNNFTFFHAPVKRVIISNFGKIQFNPDESQYIYFSKTDNHHIYYIYSRVLKIILEELQRYKNSQVYKSINLPDNIQQYYLFSQCHTSILKNVHDFFKNYVPTESVELVTLNYLKGFSDFLNKCSINNKKKTGNTTPEVSDTRTFGGAYGINDAWLTLLKSCTVSTSQSKIELDDFFEFLIANSYRGTVCRSTLNRVLTTTPEFLNILKLLKYTELPNPEFYDKNNVNKMLHSMHEIEHKKLYNPNVCITKKDFKITSKELKDEITSFRE